jgi:1-acyl-sn-glycerol-3-phosphate acyltransferase
MKLLRIFYIIYAFAIFIALMLLVFPLAIIAMLFGKIRGANMVYRLCMLWGDVWFLGACMRVIKIYEAPHQKEDKYIFVTNHISFMDTPLLVKAFRHPLRPLGKVEMVKVPIFGFIYRNAIVTVDRSCPKNRAESIRTLKSIINKGISVLVFPEGTFNTTHQPLKEFYNGAFRLAIETQTSLKPVLFLDTFDRMNYESIFSLNPGKCRIVYLPEINVQGMTMDDLENLKQKVYNIMEQKLIDYKASWIKE